SIIASRSTRLLTRPLVKKSTFILILPYSDYSLIPGPPIMIAGRYLLGDCRNKRSMAYVLSCPHGPLKLISQPCVAHDRVRRNCGRPYAANRTARRSLCSSPISSSRPPWIRRVGGAVELTK